MSKFWIGLVWIGWDKCEKLKKKIREGGFNVICNNVIYTFIPGIPKLTSHAVLSCWNILQVVTISTSLSVVVQVKHFVTLVPV